MIAIAASRMIWYSLSVSVCAGATVIESPVCTPIGSKFSIEQTMTTLSLPSRITSSSNSFQPGDRLLDQDLADRRRLEPPGDVRRGTPRRWSAKPPPVPPSVRDGRMMTGQPDARPARASASSSVRATPLRGRSRPIARIVCLEEVAVLGPLDRVDAWRRSARRRSARARPRRARSSARLRPVCPPIVGRSASGRSRSMIRSSTSTVSGSM